MDKVFLVWFFVASAICGATMVGVVIGGARELWRCANGRD